MPNRILHERICTSETLAALAPAEEVFFYRLLVQCDDYGRFDGRPVVLRARCFPLLLDGVSDADIERWLTAVTRVGLVQRYVVEGRPYVRVLRWDKYQQTRASKPKYPAPPEPDGNGNPLLAVASTCEQMSPYSYSYPGTNSIPVSVPDVASDSTEVESPPAVPPTPIRAAPKRAAGRDLGPLILAFQARSLAAPKLPPKEVGAAQQLLRHYSEDDLAACWQDIAAGDYGDGVSSQNLSFCWLVAYNRVGNWQTWRDQGRPHRFKPRAGPARRAIGTQDFDAAALIASFEREYGYTPTGS